MNQLWEKTKQRILLSSSFHCNLAAAAMFAGLSGNAKLQSCLLPYIYSASGINLRKWRLDAPLPPSTKVE
jgi:hypothetical protein